MAWIESHQTLGQHPKTRRLARYLSVSLPTVIGHLHYLWWWALDYAQDGNLSKFEPEDIADAALWEGDAVAFVEALIKAGFVDRKEEGLFIHDWDEYAGRLIDKRKANRERQRKWREQHVTNALLTHDKGVTNEATKPKPNHTIPNQININNITSEVPTSDVPPDLINEIQSSNTEHSSEAESAARPAEPSEVPPKPPKYLPEHMELAEHLRDRILDNKPDARLPTSLVKWAETARLMVERDNRSPERIREVINWCQSHHFWWRNILSMESLRKHFDRLEAEMSGAPGNGMRSRDSPRKKPAGVNRELAEQIADYKRRMEMYYRGGSNKKE